jgi:hypothetical protein
MTIVWGSTLCLVSLERLALEAFFWEPVCPPKQSQTHITTSNICFKGFLKFDPVCQIIKARSTKNSYLMLNFAQENDKCGGPLSILVFIHLPKTCSRRVACTLQVPTEVSYSRRRWAKWFTTWRKPASSGASRNWREDGDVTIHSYAEFVVFVFE